MTYDYFKLQPLGASDHQLFIGSDNEVGKYKVCVYAICKNEERFVDRWMDSMSEADLIVVTDTGSDDHTAERLRERGAVVFIDKINPWRFDTARNISLSHVPDDTDICVCTDLDEVFERGWRESLEKAWSADTAQGRYQYNWSLKSDGAPDITMVYFKIHSRLGFEWKCPVHEYLAHTGERPLKSAYIDGLVLNHYPDSSKSRGSYLPLLELAAAEDPLSDRAAYYLGREYMYRGEWEKCIAALERHLSLPTAFWAEERCASMRWIAKSYRGLGNIGEAYCWYYRAIAEAPDMRDPYIEFAEMGYELGDWPLVFYLTAQALKIREKSFGYVNMGYCWDHTPDDLAAISCYQLEMYESSLSHAKSALQFNPDDERLINNLRLIEEKTTAQAISVI